MSSCMLRTVNTIVFDIDETLCGFHSGPECIQLTYFRLDYHMYPHFNHLLDFLLTQNCFITFFSHGPKERNEPMIEEYLSDNRMLGSARYRQLKADGQFEVYSRHHCQEVTLDDGWSASYKPLKQIMKCGQTIDDILLVDDMPFNAAPGEEPLIQIPYRWDACEFNNMYYLLGLFMEYFLVVVPKTGQSLRCYFRELPKVDKWIPVNLLDYTMLGLCAVRQITPEAVLYPGSWKTNNHNVTMKDVVPSIDCIEYILDKTVHGFTVNSGLITTFLSHLQMYFVPYYRDTLTDEEKHRLPERVKKLVLECN